MPSSTVVGTSPPVALNPRDGIRIILRILGEEDPGRVVRDIRRPSQRRIEDLDPLRIEERINNRVAGGTGSSVETVPPLWFRDP